MAYEDSMFIPPWHIWTADFINNEKWDRYKDMLEFTHPGGHEQLPKEITKLVKEWKRPNELFGTDDVVILPDDDTNDVLKLMTTNKPLMNVKLYKWILFHVIMYIHRFQNKSPIPWHPCSIIFSRCKVDGTWNKNPKPEYNPFGKYWLKLFYMGEFRLICVSDHLPISKSGQILLPLCNNKKNLWLPLLIKGLLRVHAIVRNINQFNTITCLTGWTCIRENCWNFQKKDLWLDLMAHNPRPLKNDYKVASKTENHYKQTKITNKISHKECYSMDDSEKKCFHEDDISLYQANPPNSIVTSIFLSPSPVDRIQTSSSTHFNYEQSIPILINSVEMLKNEEVPTWKTIRWTKWAVDNNIKQPHEINEFRKTINFCTPFTALLDQSSSLKILLDKYQNTTDPERREMDFFYLEPFVESIEIYFKKNEAFPFVKSIQFLEFKNNERDQCVYMHIESQYCESILFTFTACQNISLNGGMMIANTENQIENPFVAIETFQWYKVELSTPILYIWSKHSFANIIKIKSGYTLLRIWGDLPEIYSFTIESTVVFTIYNSEEEVFRALTIQPKSLSLFITNVQKAFTKLSVAETHTNNHDEALLQFYLSFMPTIGINEQFLDKANRCKDIRKLVQDAIINWATMNCPKDITIIEIFTNFQEMFQERTLGRDQIAQILENERKERDNSQNIIIDVQPSKETKTNDDKSINMGLKKSQYTENKTTIKNSSPKNSFKTDIIKGIQDNMFDIIYDTLVNMQTNYHPYRDCLQNYGVMISQDIDFNELTIDNYILFFRFQLNTHSVTKPVPNIILVSKKDGTSNGCLVNLCLFENGKCVHPVNSTRNMFMVRRANRGYTLIGWVSKESKESLQNGCKISIFGRPNEILHTCTNNHKFYKLDHCLKKSLEKTELTTQNVVDAYLRPNFSHVLARANFSIENAGLFTFYCKLSDINSLLELRISIKNKKTSSVIASIYERGDTILLPLILLEPNVNVLQNFGEEEIVKNTLFVIEVVLAEHNNNSIFNETPKSVHGDWTITCVYEQKLTDVFLGIDDTQEYSYRSSIPPQTVNQSQYNSIINQYQKSQRSSNNDDEDFTPSVENVSSKVFHNDILNSILINEDKINKLKEDEKLHPFQTEEEQNNALANEVYRQNNNERFIKKILQQNEKNRKIVNEEIYMNMTKLLNLNAKPKSHLSVTRSHLKKTKM